MTKRKKSKSGGQSSADHEITKVTRDEGMIVKVFGGQDDAGDGTGTKQLPKDHFEKDIKAGNVISPLYDPLVWAFLLEQNTRLNKLVRSMAENTVGLGYELVPLKPEDEMWVEQNRDSINKEREAVAPLLENPNDEMAFNQLMQHVKIDEEATGQGWIEVVRSQDGSEVKQLFHIPSYTMRVAKGGDRYVQMRPSDTTKKVYFKKFGDTRMLSASTGEWGKPDAPVDPDDQANEVVQFKLYTPRSSFYGVPRVVSAAPAVAGTRLAHRRNVSFFENDATPRLAIIVNGGELSDESMEMIEDFIDSRGKGPGNAGRIMVLQARGADHMLGGGENLKITVMPLTIGVQDDASFNRYTMANNEEVRECFGIGQIFIGTSDDVNRAVALAMKQLTVEQVFVPESKRYEYRLNNTIIKTFAVKHIKLQFVRPRTTDTLMEAQAFSMLSAVGGVTPNDVRDFLNKPRFEGKWANTPIALLKQGLLQDTGDELATIWTAYGDKMPPMNLVDAQAKAMGAKAAMEAAEGGQQPAAAAKMFDNIDPSDLEDLMGEMNVLAEGLRKLGFNVTIEPLNPE